MLNRFSVLIITLIAGISMFCQPAAAAEKTIVFASDATWPPMEFVDEQKNLVGYAIDMVYAIAKEADSRLRLKTLPGTVFLPGLPLASTMPLPLRSPSRMTAKKAWTSVSRIIRYARP